MSYTIITPQSTPQPTPQPSPQPTPQPNAQSTQPLVPPYSLYWTRYKHSCPNKINSYFELNMKRKALTLQHNRHTQLKNINVYIKAVNNQNRIVNRFLHNSKKNVCHLNIYSSASQSNVPGNKSFILYNDPKTPIYN